MIIDKQKIKKILVIKLRHHGDVLLTSPVIENLKKNIPQAEIDAYIYKETTPMLEGLLSINKLILYDKSVKKKNFFKKLLYELSLLLHIRRQKYDLVINLTEGDRGALVALFSKAKYRIGMVSKGKGMLGKDKLFTHLCDPYANFQHTVEMNLEFLKPLEIFPNVEDRFLQFTIPSKDQAYIDSLLAKEKIEDFILIHPVSRWMFKSWPASKMAELLKEIYQDKKLPFVFTCAPIPEELEFNQTVINLLGKDIRVIDFSGKSTLKQLGATINRARAVITVDSASMHLCAALQTPVVAIFGPTSEKRWGPWQHRNAQVVFKEMKCRPCYKAGCNNSYRSECLETLDVEQVKKAFYNLKLLPK